MRKDSKTPGTGAKIAIAVSAAIIVFAAVCGLFVRVRISVPTEEKLMETISAELLEYTVNGEIHKSAPVGMAVAKDRKSGKEYEAYCEIELSDEYMDRTLYVAMEYENDLLNGWQLCGFQEYDYPVLELKQGFDRESALDYLSEAYAFGDISYNAGESRADADSFVYAFDINKACEYIDISGRVYVDESISRPQEACGDVPVEYICNYASYTDALEYTLKAEGMWVGEFSDKQLRLEIISVSDNKAKWESSTKIYAQDGSTDYVSTSSGTSDLYFDEAEQKFYFDLATDEGNYELSFWADSAELVSIGDYAQSFGLNNDIELEAENDAQEDFEKIYIYTWNSGMDEYIDAFKERYPQYADSVEVVNLGMIGDSDEYYNAISFAIDGNGENAPSIVAYDSDMLDCFSGSDFVALEDIGLTADMYSNAYGYTIELGTFDGELKAVTNWASPVCFVYRKDIALEVLGTSDPEEVGKYVNNFDVFMYTAEKMKQAGYYMLSGADDISPVKEVLESRNEYDEIYQALEDNGYTAGTQMWDLNWCDNFEGNVFGYFSVPWFTTWILDMYADSDTYGVTYAPESYYWGGTYYGVTRCCANDELAALLLYTLCCDTDFMAETCSALSEFPNNRASAEIMSASGASKVDCLGAQEPFAIYDKIASQLELGDVIR